MAPFFYVSELENAMAYDATKAIIEGLKKSQAREKLQEQIKNNRPFCGATGEASFEKSGKRHQEQAFIIQVVEDKKTDTGYDFIAVLSWVQYSSSSE